MKKIILTPKNRDGHKLWFEPEEDYYRLKADSDSALEFLRIIMDTDGSVLAIDPSGGPFTAVGDKISDYTITKITIGSEKGIRIFLEKDA